MFMPGQRRRKLSQSIDGVADVARSRAEADGLDPLRARLWKMLCDATGQTLQQLLVKNDDRRLDWGLKKHSKRVSDPVLVVLFWWMLIYQIVVFKNRGLDGYTPDDEVGPMYEVAKRFVETEFARMEVENEPPGPWAQTVPDRVGDGVLQLDLLDAQPQERPIAADRARVAFHHTHGAGIRQAGRDVSLRPLHCPISL